MCKKVGSFRELGTTEVIRDDIGDMVSVLALFKEAMKLLEGEKYVTGSYVNL
jgi:hypothetical protein